MANDPMGQAGRGGGTATDAAKLLLRITLGVLILLHGVSKIKGGPGFILDVVERAGLPEPLGYLVYVGEVLAPLLIIVGWWTRVAAFVVAVNMVFAILLVHTGDLAKLNETGGWALELQGLFLAVAIAVTLRVRGATPSAASPGAGTDHLHGVSREAAGAASPARARGARAAGY